MAKYRDVKLNVKFNLIFKIAALWYEISFTMHNYKLEQFSIY
ncbi:hypothetical protein PULV_a0945 [Pseudoalteromonas ulvae UL12]|nr:hypothetical protein [Pseudoalteromonas ulvae UL12]